MRRSSVLALLGGMIFASTSILNGQGVSYTLSSNLSDSTKAYVARDYVSMQPGFRFVASSGKTFNAKTDPTLIFPPPQNYMTPSGQLTTNPAQGGVVGSIPGQFAVSPTGGATYTIPIECPAGINGIQPNISLVYNSQGGNGIAGWGWNIGGMSTIGRTLVSNYYDGTTSSYVWDNTTPLTFDGQRLFELQRWGNDSVLYTTECESYTRIVGYDIRDFGPLFFKVYQKSGIVVQYGDATNIGSYRPLDVYDSSVGLTVENMRRNLSWNISKISDPNGNYMSFIYDTNYSTNQSYKSSNISVFLDRIEYGGNTSGTPANLKLSFEYQVRLDSITKYIYGNNIPESLILQNIKTESNGVTINKYELSYIMKENRNFLSDIILSGQNQTHYNPIHFNWSANEYTFSFKGTVCYESTPLLVQYRNEGYQDGTQISRMFGDIDGDGDQDVVLKFTLKDLVYNAWYWLNGRPEYESNYKYFWAIYRNDNGVFRFLYNKDWDIKSNLLFKDDDFDGREELYEGHEPYNRIGKLYYFYVYRYDLNNQQIAVYPDEVSIQGPSVPCDKLVYSGDFLGDGSSQYIFLYKNITANNIVPLDNNRNGIITSQLPTVSRARILITDMNGNGKQELLFLKDNESTFYEVKDTYMGKSMEGVSNTVEITRRDQVFPGDFNGDGNTDLLVWRDNSKLVEVYISTGLMVRKVDELSFYMPDDFFCNLRVLDANKDGFSDVLITHYDIVNNRCQFKMLTMDGTKHFVQRCISSWNEIIDPVSAHDVNIGRINSDSYDDILFTDPLNFEDRYYSFSENVTYNKLISVADPYGNVTQIDYGIFDAKNSIQRSVSQNTEDNPSDAPISLSTIGSWDVVNGTKTISKTGIVQSEMTYEYNTAVIHRQGKGFLGYKQLLSWDNIHSIQKKSINQLSSTNAVLYPSVDSTWISGQLTSAEAIGYQFIPNGLRYEIRLANQYSRNFVKNQSALVEYLSYDNWGNLIETKTTKDNLFYKQKITYGKYGAWCVNKPKTIISTTILGSDSTSRRKDFYYNRFGNLTREVVDSLDDNKVATNYSNFDIYGHPLLTVSTANGNSRTSSKTYTESGRFVLSETNILNETKQYLWDECRGVLLQETNRYGVAVYHYDNMGQLIGSKSPDGKATSRALRWANPGNMYGAACFEESQTSGSAPETFWYNGLGRKIVHETIGLNNQTIRTFSEYYPDGKSWRVSKPTFEATPQSWDVTNTYNIFGQLSSVTTPMGISSYDYDGLTSFVFSPTGISTQKLYPNGMKEYVIQNGKRVDFTYYSTGLLKTATPQGGSSLQMEYDLQGNRKKLTDPDAGVVESIYDGFGELLSESQQMHNAQLITTLHNYNSTTGLLQNLVRNGETTTYSYDELHRLTSISIVGKHTKSFVYDTFDRVVQESDAIGEKVFTFKTEYDALGSEKKRIYSSGYYTMNFYDTTGILIEVKDAYNRSLYKPLSENANGQLTKESWGGREIVYGYNDKGLPDSISSIGIIRQKYEFDSKGNLGNRQDKLTNQKEIFTYDGMNRLTYWNVYKNNVLTRSNSQSYDFASGNISNRSDLDNLSLKYGVGGRPHALDSIAGIPSAFSTANLAVTYTDFKKISTLSEGNRFYELTYGVDEQRLKSVYKVNNSTKLTRYYLDDYEEEVFPNGTVRKIHYLSGGAILISTNGQDSLLYGYTDYQGSLIALTDENGNVLERYAYDPWGNRRNPDNWTLKDTRTAFLLNRGYTGHEHLDAFGIINMNGRVYDPLTAQFFSPDPFVQAPEDWLNYNRYSYCLNNPMKYTDPSGDFWNYVISAAIGGVWNVIANRTKIDNLGDFIGYFSVGAASALLGSAVGVGVSSALAKSSSAILSVSKSFITGFITGASSGFSSGFVTSFGNSLVEHKEVGEALGSGIRSGIMGGITAGLFQGFWDGFSAKKSGMEFFDGSKKTTLVNQEIPKIGAKGDMNCGPANVEMVDRSFGGSLSQESARGWFGGDVDKVGLYDSDLWKKYCTETGHSFSWETDKSESVENILSTMKNGGRVSVNTETGMEAGHSVIIKSVTQKVYTNQITGDSFTKYVFKSINPANGGYYENLSIKNILSARNIFYINR